MNDAPTLKKCSVQIKYASSDGYKMDFLAKSGQGTKHLLTGEEVPAEQAMTDALKQLAIISVVFGMEGRALQTFKEEQERFAKFRKERQAKGTT